MKKSNYQQKRNAFTLVELLVVISIIALLLSVLIPSLNNARKIARAAVCQNNLKSWGMFYQLYANDYGGKFPIWDGYGNTTKSWTYRETFRKYYKDVDTEGLKVCPSAKVLPTVGYNVHSYGHEFGKASCAWFLKGFPPDDPKASGSYGENSWIREYFDDDPSVLKMNEKSWKNFNNLITPSRVPLLLDARWIGARPDDTQRLPRENFVPENAFYNMTNWTYAECFAMRRHKDGINVVFGDLVAHRIKAEDLWGLKWHKFYKGRDVKLFLK